MTDHRLIDQEDTEDVDYDDIWPHQRWTFAVDGSGDIMYDEDTQSIPNVSGEEAVKQSLNVALGTVKGEDEIDEGFGLNVFEATKSYRHIEREIRKALIYDDKHHDRVDAVTEVEIEEVGGGRRARVSVEVKLKTGEIELLQIDIGGVQ